MSQAGILKVTTGSLPPSVATSYVTNSGTAVPAANVLQLLATTVPADGIPAETVGSGNTVTTEIQISSAAALTSLTNAGLASFNSTEFIVDTNGFVSLVASGIPYYSLTPYIVGQTGDIHAQYTGVGGIAAAIAQAVTDGASSSSPKNIYVKPGTYTTALTLHDGINIIGLATSGEIGPVISGQITFSTAGTSNISGCYLVTNSAFAIVVGGIVATVLNINNCYFSAISAAQAISFTSSSASAQINIHNCTGTAGTVVGGLFTSSSAGTINISEVYFYNPSANASNNLISAGSLNVYRSYFEIQFQTSGTNAAYFNDVYINTAAAGITGISIGGSGTNAMRFCTVSSDGSPAIGTGTTATVEHCTINSSSGTAFSSTGNLFFSYIDFPNNSANFQSNLNMTPLMTNPGASRVTLPAVDYTVLSSDYFIGATTSAARAITLPATPARGQTHIIKDITPNASINNITISGNGNNILGSVSAATYVINTNGGSITLIFDGTVWCVT